MKRQMRWQAVAAWLVLGAGGVAWAQGLSFDAEAGLPIRLGDQVLVSTESDPWPIGAEQVRTLAGDGALTRLGEDFRKEFARVDDRLEYTFQFDNLPTSEGAWTYSLDLPLPTGSAVQVMHGSYRSGTSQRVVIGQTQSSFSMVRFITINTPVGGYAIDTDPAGAWQDSANFDKALRTSRLEVRDDGLRLHFTRRWNNWGGGRIQAKLVFYSQPVAFETIHPFHHASYKTPLAALYFLNFTQRYPGRDKHPVSVTTETFDAERGYGWVDPPSDLAIVTRKPKGQIHAGFTTASSHAMFRMACPPGDYLLTVIVGDLDASVGPMEVAVDGRPFAELTLQPAGFISRTTVVRADDGVIDLTLNGRPWALNGIILQPLQLAHEDYIDRQPWWRHDVDTSAVGLKTLDRPTPSAATAPMDKTQS